MNSQALSDSSPQPTSVPVPTRPGRALIGWMPIDQGAQLLSGIDRGQAPDAADIAACEAAHAAVAARTANIDQSAAFLDIPSELTGHLNALAANPRAATVLPVLGEPKLIDLSKICAAQPVIHTEDALQRVEGTSPDDLLAIAQVTMPIRVPQRMPVAFDPVKMIWILSSPNPNLRVFGHFAGEVENRPAHGFIVEVSTSYLHVAGLHGRYFLRDGYHRAYGLLAAGINIVPGFVRDYQTIEEAGMPAGLLPQHAYLGDRPAMLQDYLDDDVSAEVEVPVTEKVLIIQALEVNTVG
jgi:hypothetical protein